MSGTLLQTEKIIAPIKKTKHKNQNFIDNQGIIQNIYLGDQTASTINKTCEELESLIKQLRKKKKRVLILTDTLKLGKINLAVRKIGLEIMQNLDYDRVAIVGTSQLYENLVKTMILVSGRGFKVRYFTSKVEAKKWLLSSSHL